MMVFSGFCCFWRGILVVVCVLWFVGCVFVVCFCLKWLF